MDSIFATQVSNLAIVDQLRPASVDFGDFNHSYVISPAFSGSAASNAQTLYDLPKWNRIAWMC